MTQRIPFGNPLCAFLFVFCSLSCEQRKPEPSQIVNLQKEDSLEIAQMITVREQAMIKKDIQTALDQFSENATWINSQGYYFEGREHVAKFHQMLTGNDSLDYYYEAGKPRIRLIDPKNAIAYYSWKMFWYKKATPADTTFKEIGLMTLSAHKENTHWKWTAVTNQHTPWFYENVEPISVD